MTGFDHITMQKLQELDGSRGVKSRQRAAVRIQDLQAITEIDKKLRAVKAAGSTPTKAEFDALVEDVRRVHTALAAVSEVLTNRLTDTDVNKILNI